MSAADEQFESPHSGLNNAPDKTSEARLAELFGHLQEPEPAATEADATRALARIRELSLARFIQCAPGIAPPIEASRELSREETSSLPPGPGETPTVSSPPASATASLTPVAAVNIPSRSFMLPILWRGLVALAASVAIYVAFFHNNPPAVSAVPFGNVLDKLRQHDSLQFLLKRNTGGNPSQAEVLVRAPGLVRMNESPERYSVAIGSRFWKIDETKQSVTQQDSPWFISPSQQIDLLALLDTGVTDAERLRAALPSEVMEYEGELCEVYRVTLPGQTTTGATSEIEIEAYANQSTHELVALAAWPAGQGRGAGAPLAELHLVAINPVIPAEKFQVPQNLVAAGQLPNADRIGQVTDSQGIVLLRPALSKRWTVVTRDLAIQPGDWIRTELRGANAVKLTLNSQTELTLGPGTLVECLTPSQAKLHRGEVRVKQPTDKLPEFTLLGPLQGSEKIASGQKILHTTPANQLAVTPVEPKWLAGFDGTAVNEMLGSLVVTMPDGRNVPLTVGYHKVTVEIKDQIARTTIEESFVNRTNSRLEGIFHFPLPQDASISGFGMWIGNELVEADVVEKQRAREIYETILRERRDPGLLEWTAGNLFKARVFPIEAQSEKRIKIVYTQVLPLRGNAFRYNYALRSELLRQTPLRELSLSVIVDSTTQLKTVSSPTHPVRISKTPHAAQIDFSAQEFTPEQDFELVFELDDQRPDLAAIAHRRGSDGYFLLQLMPPTGADKWQRETLPDGTPLNLVLLCDTSASLDADQRRLQGEFVTALVGSLGADDRYLLAAADVQTTWANVEPLAPTPENLEKTQKFLEARPSLGWTNLELAFTSVLEKAPAGATVVYIGDGIVTAGQSDPQQFVKHLTRQLAVQAPASGQAPTTDVIDGKEAPAPAPATDHKETPQLGKNLTFHAVTVDNTYELAVLRGIANAGRGSLRQITGEQTPVLVAKQLLQEIANPGLTDLAVDFRGLQVAAVYPERLPNLAAGTQQIIVGRYLPTGDNQTGEVIITGKRGQETVRYAARLNLPDNDAGNSFIPRLWARGHLDFLLQQGTNPAIRDQIIALSEEFHIITPYTSLLVLETDADRQRFKVQRRYLMRDGEEFFAAATAKANFELLQQQRQQAGAWRSGLRASLLAQWSQLGRNSELFSEQSHYRRSYLGSPEFRSKDTLHRFFFQRGAMPASGPLGSMSATDGRFDVWASGPMLGGMGGGGDMLDVLAESDGENYFREELVRRESLSVSDKEVSQKLSAENKSEFWDVNGQNGEFGVEELSLGLRLKRESDRKSVRMLMDEPFGGSESELAYAGQPIISNGTYFDGFAGLSASGARAGYSLFDDTTPMLRKPYSMAGRGIYYEQSPDYLQWLDALLPSISAPAARETWPTPQPTKWSPEAIALAKSLLITETLLQHPGGVEVIRREKSFEPQWGREYGIGEDLTLFSSQGWLTRSLLDNSEVLVNYCQPDQRGVFSLMSGWGTARPALRRELTTFPTTFNDGSITTLLANQVYLTATVEAAGPNRAKLILASDDNYRHEYTIDTERKVLLRRETHQNGKLVGTDDYSDFVRAGGVWWWTKLQTNNAEGQSIHEVTRSVAELTAADFTKKLETELAPRAQTILVTAPFPTLAPARAAAAAGQAGINDRLVLLVHNCLNQQWDEALTHVAELEKLTAAKPGSKWLRPLILSTMRRNEEARVILLAAAKQLAANAQPQELPLANWIYSQAQTVSSPEEQWELLQILRPVYDRAPKFANAMDTFVQNEYYLLQNLNRQREVLDRARQLAEAAPWEVYRQTQYTDRLVALGEFTPAFAWLQKELDRPVKLDQYHREALQEKYLDYLAQLGRWPEVLQRTTAAIEQLPESRSAHEQYLAALVFNNKLAEADKLAAQWLAEGQVASKLSPTQRVKLDAALNYMRGGVWRLNLQLGAHKWHPTLAAATRHFFDHQHNFSYVQTILGSNILDSTPGDELRAWFFAQLRERADQLTPEQTSLATEHALTGQLSVAEPINNRKYLSASEVPAALWQPIAKILRERFRAVKTDADRAALGNALRLIYVNKFADTELLPFLRERLQTAPANQVTQLRRELVDHLLGLPWTPAIEDELFTILRELRTTSDEQLPLFEQLGLLHRYTDALLQMRITAGLTAWRDQGGVNKLTRTERAAEEQKIRDTARAQLIERYISEHEKVLAQAGNVNQPAAGNPAAEPVKEIDSRTPPAEQAAALANWIRVEQAYLQVPTDANLTETLEFCWQIVGEVPFRAAEDDATEREQQEKPLQPELPGVGGNSPADPATELELIDDQNPAQLLAQAQKIQAAAIAGELRERAFITILSLTARESVGANWKERLAKFIAAGLDFPAEERFPWQKLQYQWLVATNQIDELLRVVRVWSAAAEPTSPWPVALAKLLAEQGDLSTAVTLFETAASRKLLTPGDYQTLAQWYLALNQRDKYDDARLRAWRLLPESQLNNIFNNVCYRWQSGGTLPTTIDDNQLLAIRALFEKSSQPENYLSELRQLYLSSADFRLLRIIPRAVLGRSAQQIYRFMETLHGTLDVIRVESTADEILAEIKQIRTGKLTTTDARALDLVEALVEYQAAAVLNQPGPHITASVAALQRAFNREWQPNEPALMGIFLTKLGRVPHWELAAEQLRQLAELTKLVKPGSTDDLHLGRAIAELEFYNLERPQDGLRRMRVTCERFLAQHENSWPIEEIDNFFSLIGMHEYQKQFSAGEDLLIPVMDQAANTSLRQRVLYRLAELYNRALREQGSVSIGAGNELLPAVTRFYQQKIDAADQEHERYELTRLWVDALGIGHERKLPATMAEVRKLAFTVMPGILEKQVQQYANTVTLPASIVKESLGLVAALRYVIERYEQYPDRLRYDWNNAWRNLGGLLAQYRASITADNDEYRELEPRLWKIVADVLRQELQTLQTTQREMTHIDYSYFWHAKAEEMVAIANEVLAQNVNSHRHIMFIAEYLWSGLHRYDRSIEILFAADKAQLLDFGGQEVLVQHLIDRNRSPEAIALLEQFVAARPDEMRHRTRLMQAYFAAKRPQQLSELLAATDKHFHAGGRWLVGNIQSLGDACLSVELYPEAEKYLSEAISLRLADNTAAGQGDRFLSDLYISLSKALIAQNKNEAAVDAALSAVSCWDPRYSERENTLRNLREIVEKIADLPAFIQELDARIARTNQDWPILRLTLAQVLATSNQHELAVTQFQHAYDLQPTNAQIFGVWLESLEKLGDTKQAVAVLQKWIEQDRRNASLYSKLAEKLAADQKTFGPDAEERALTSIIEAAPTESESFTALAEIRGQRQQWALAIPLWQKVAELRSLEPTGLVRLAEAQIQTKAWGEARETLNQLRGRVWPERFNGELGKLPHLEQQVLQGMDEKPK
ncbi:MAG: VIT domain-containing protein [Pirellulales bacterium]|nr:VIT domain-containing protein [Pirellulales bacterium]